MILPPLVFPGAGMLNFCFYACKGAHTLFSGQRERESGRCRIWLLNLINNHKVKKEMTGALAPFSYLVSL